MILMRAPSITRTIGRGGPWNREQKSLDCRAHPFQWPSFPSYMCGVSEYAKQQYILSPPPRSSPLPPPPLKALYGTVKKSTATNKLHQIRLRYIKIIC